MGDFKDAFVARFGADTSEFDKALKKLERNTKSSMEKVTAVTNASAVAFAGLASAVAFTTAVFVKFEKGLIAVQKTTNLSDKEIENLGDDLLNISKTAPVAISSLLSISEAAGQLGITGRQNVVKFTDTVAKLEATTNLQGEEAAKTLARILNVTGENVESVDKLGSAFVKLGNEVAASEAEIATNTAEVAKSTAIFGIGAANATALGASMAELGIQAEIGGSVVGRAFIKIKDGIDNGGESLAALSRATGIASKDLKQAFEKDATGVFVKFLKSIKNVTAAGGNATQFLEQFGLKGAGVGKVLAPLALRVEGVEKNLIRANTEFANATALEDEFTKASESVAAQLEVTKNKITAAQIELGEKFAPVILEVSKKVGGLFESFSNLDEGTIATIARIGLAATVFAGIITTLGLVTKAVMVLRVALIGLGVGTGTGPLVMVVTALGVLAAGVVSFWATAVDETEEAEKKIAKAAKKIEKETKKAAEATAKAWSEAINAWKGETPTDLWEKQRLANIKQRAKEEKEAAAAAKEEVKLLREKEAAKNDLRVEANRKALKAREKHAEDMNAVGRDFLRTQLELVNEEVAKVTLALKRKNDQLRSIGRTFLQEQQAADASAGIAKQAAQDEIEASQVASFQEFRRKIAAQQTAFETAEAAHIAKMQSVGQAFLTAQTTKDAAEETALKDHYAKMIALNAKYLKDKEAQEGDATTEIVTPITTGSQSLDTILVTLGSKLQGLSGAIAAYNSNVSFSGNLPGMAVGAGIDLLMSNEEFAAAFEELNTIIGEVLAPVIVELIPILESIGEVLIALSPLIEKMVPAIKTVALVISEFINLFVPLIDTIDELVENITSMFESFSSHFESLTSTLSSLKDVFTNVGEFIKSLSTVISGLSTALSSIGTLLTTLSTSLTSVATTVSTLTTGMSSLTTAVVALTEPINSLISAMDSFNPFSGGGGGSGLFGFHEGGFIEDNKATTIPSIMRPNIHDTQLVATQPGEFIIPKDTSSKLMNYLKNIPSGGGKQSVNVTIGFTDDAVNYITEKQRENTVLDT